MLSCLTFGSDALDLLQVIIKYEYTGTLELCTRNILGNKLHGGLA